MHQKLLLFAGAAIVAACAIASIAPSQAAEGDKVISDFMKKYHKAPQGTDPVCKKVGAGQATDAELAELLAGYQAIGAATPPKGEVADWKTKCEALVSAIKLVQAKDPGGVAAYKTAVNCKSCHSLHKPD